MRAQVIVVGAGPVGLVSTLLLASAGIDVVLIEACAEVSDDLRASTFHPPTLDLLAPLGVTDALVEQGLKCPDWQIRMHETGESAVFDMSLLAADTRYPFRLQCEQARLCADVRARLDALSTATLLFGRPVKYVGQNSTVAWVEIPSTAGRSFERVSADFVVAADGASSTVRELLGCTFEGFTYPETTVLVSTPYQFQTQLATLSNVNYCWSERGNFALLRLKKFWRCSLYFEPGLSETEALAEERLQGQLAHICRSNEPFEIIDRRCYSVHQRIVDNYRRGRVFLAGDAAHVNSPSGGMGMNGGIHDAFNLTEKLIAVLQGEPQCLLNKYDAQRRPIAEQDILSKADANRKRMTERDPGKRRASLRALQKIADDPERARQHLLGSSMIAGLRRAAALA